MKRWSILALSVLLILSLAGCGQSSELRLGTGGIGGTYYAFGNALSQQLGEESEPVPLTVKTTSGSAANLRLLREGFLQLAIVQSDTLADAVNGTGAFEQAGSYGGYAAVAGLYAEACQIVVPAASDIQTVQDLAGHRVSVGEQESGVLKNAEEILLSHGLSLQMIEPSCLSFADSADALERGEIDAFFCTAGAPTTAITELAGHMDVRLLSISPEAESNLLSLGTGYTACTVPANTYPGQTEDVTTVGIKAVLVADSSVKEEQIAAITRYLLENGAKLNHSVNVTLPTEPEYAVTDIPCSFHAGSAACYAEQGINVEVASGGNNKPISAAQD